MPRGQDQGRDSCLDLVQPSQVVWDNTAAPDATKGLPQPEPAATAGPVQSRARFASKEQISPLWQQTPTSGRNSTFWFSNWTNFWAGAKAFAPSPKIWFGRTLQEQFDRLFSCFDNYNARTLDIE